MFAVRNQFANPQTKTLSAQFKDQFAEVPSTVLLHPILGDCAFVSSFHFTNLISDGRFVLCMCFAVVLGYWIGCLLLVFFMTKWC